ncbi:hypothetical protein ACIRRH_25470 [Kitasatospora sp. NPDC101235]|uniref:hypothetical protein n=1 Tax=Kitasatospora sp. NPDC101235 TaxID=3364101 RepID=UPI0038053FB4
MTVRSGTLELARELERPETAYLASFTANGVTEDFEVGWDDLAQDTDWARERLGAWGLGRGKRVVLSFSGHEGAWFLPVIGALKQLGVTYAVAETFGQDWRRTLVFQRELQPDAVLGITADTVRALAEQEDLAELFGATPIVLGRLDAAPELRAAGVATGVLAPFGPTLLVECPTNPGAHLNGAQWWVGARRGRLYLSSRPVRRCSLPETGLGLYGTVLTDRCGCGSDDPRVLVRPRLPLDQD